MRFERETTSVVPTMDHNISIPFSECSSNSARCKNAARNPEKSLSEFGIREGEKVKIEKERELANRGLSINGCARSDIN